MTTRWTITPEWKGQTVAVLATGPSMTKALADSLRRHRTIAVNHAVTVAPWADMLVALDLPWHDSFKAFKGIRVAGSEDESLDARYAGTHFERVEIAPGNVIQFRNSGLQAIRIAAAMGAARILLAGFDPEAPGAREKYPGLAEGLAQLQRELMAAGIQVLRVPAQEDASV